MVTSYLSEFIQENTDSGRRSFARPLLRYMLHPLDVECPGTGNKYSLKLQFIHVGLRHI